MSELILGSLAVLFALPVFLLAVATPAAKFAVSSSAFGDGKAIPTRHATKAVSGGQNASPVALVGELAGKVPSRWLLPASTGIPSPTTGFIGWSSTLLPVLRVCLGAHREPRCFRQGPKSWRTRLGRWAGKARSHRLARALIHMSFCSMP
jgi:hypothetical protein